MTLNAESRGSWPSLQDVADVSAGQGSSCPPYPNKPVIPGYIVTMDVIVRLRLNVGSPLDAAELGLPWATNEVAPEGKEILARHGWRRP
jgi:hypothetical protein